MNRLLREALVTSDHYYLSTKNAWKHYLEQGRKMDHVIRPEIYHSWKSSKEMGVDPFQSRINEIISEQALYSRLAQNERLLSFVEPKMSTFTDLLSESKTMLSIVDKHGTILQSNGDEMTLKMANRLNIMCGGTWSEQSAGTNAVGVALRTKQPAQVLFSEHFCEKNHEWFCAATPIVEPFTNELLGIVNIAGMSAKSKNAIELVIAEANHLATVFINELYAHTLRDNLFLTSVVEGVDDAVIIVDSQQRIVQKNQKANDQNIQSLQPFLGISKLLGEVLWKGKRITNEWVQNANSDLHYKCSIFPVTFQEEQLGAVVFLKEQISMRCSKNDNPPVKKSSNSLSVRYTFDDLIGQSPTFKKAVKKAEKAATIDTTLFLAGETGTGKEMFAQAIHHASARSERPFVAVNCGAIPQSLFESELSGYAPGAFTGAKSKGSPGKFELANGGTIFLDEIGEMPLDMQVHLLRILEERVVTRIGGEKAIPIDVRVIAATHKNLIEAVEKGEFREDLLYRLHVIPLTIPPLRERGVDILNLIHYYTTKLSSQFHKRHIKIDDQAMWHLSQYKWPGNVRELINVVKQTLFNMEGNKLSVFDLPDRIVNAVENEWNMEKEHIQQALMRTNGNVTNAANLLGISRSTMYRRLKQHQLDQA
ncbi:sigma-54-dependent Fis family transcriptional regulator [Sporosarcina sp. HYO08]|uniref:sigma-54-dependent Fis family transcriptional regulator n=1 Tax=Sporosarcina sp. HYO08 TaxID=1759557 RepID=UPI00079AE660|nr:sigma-54-dependent Fis family transcriptional regulator [Sporosarcina sp. HYO08]KXH82012.1 transcriptional regulator [Sporosarcina sp. HYO08]